MQVGAGEAREGGGGKERNREKQEHCHHWEQLAGHLTQPAMVACKMEAQSEYVHVAYMFFARFGTDSACSVSA